MISMIFVVLVCSVSYAQTWTNLPPYNILWPLWSPALSPVIAVTSLPTPLLNKIGTWDMTKYDAKGYNYTSWDSPYNHGWVKIEPPYPVYGYGTASTIVTPITAQSVSLSVMGFTPILTPALIMPIT